MKYRAGEDPKMFFRTERMYFSNGEWFFSTRDGSDLGPFTSHEEAEAELTLYLRHSHEGSMFVAGGNANNLASSST
jgi:Domain of unknown function (DUF6316)